MSNEKKINNNNKENKPKLNFYILYAIIIGVLLILAMFNYNGQSEKQINMNKFEEITSKNYIEKVEIITNNHFAKLYLKEDVINKNEEFKDFKTKKGLLKDNNAHYYVKFGDLQNFENKLDKIKDAKALDFVVENTEESNFWGNTFSVMLPFIIIVVIWIIIMRRMSGGGGAGGGASQIFSIGKSRAKLFDEGKSVKVTFNDVAGLSGAKDEIKEIVDFLKNPTKYSELGAKIPKGALLVGPPGTGKTLLAKAVAGEAEVPFFSISGSDFVEMFVGVGASRVRDLFRRAKEKSPCIIFIDEIDTIGRERGKNPNFGGNDERENTLNQLLSEMDGFEVNHGVIILAATNRADILDKALLRPGRFDRQIHVELPDIKERKQIFEVHVKPLKISKDVDLDFLAKQTPGFSGAEIANMCNEAALIAARNQKNIIELQNFLSAVDRIVGGLEKKHKIISNEEKEVISFHESGHATVSWLTKYAFPLVKVTIVPRGSSLGAAWYLPEERSITTKEQLLDEMCAALGGRAAEYVMFGKISTGALSDLEKVTKQAYSMVSILGMNNEIGNISFYNFDGNGFAKPYSDETSRKIDEEAKKMVEEQYQRAIRILTDNKEKLIKLASKLFKKEVLFKEDLEKIFGKRDYNERNLDEFDNSIVKFINDEEIETENIPEKI